jgi:23S rRNA (uridine2552-2'-O)-methyltransferase
MASFAFATRWSAGSSAAVADYNRKDHFHQQAKRDGFRSRAVYKLAEFQQRHRVLARGQKVVDLGCWPGGWLQEASRVVGPRGRVVGVDLAEIDPPFSEPNVVALVGDIEDPSICERIREELGGRCDVLLSDAAPKLTGIRERDRAAEERLLESIEILIPLIIQPDGDFLVKLLECPEAQQFQLRMRAWFGTVKTVKAKATRKGSSERYLLARGLSADVVAEPAPPIR